MHSYPLIRILREKEKRKNAFVFVNSYIKREINAFVSVNPYIKREKNAFVSVNPYIKRERKTEKMHSNSLIRILREKEKKMHSYPYIKDRIYNLQILNLRTAFRLYTTVNFFHCICAICAIENNIFED